MSYNIDSSEYLSGKLFVEMDVWDEWIEENGDELPEGNFTDDRGHEIDKKTGDIVITKPWWYGDGSGSGIEIFELFLEKTYGNADILLCWEGGDNYTGYRVDNGNVEKKKVKMVLE